MTMECLTTDFNGTANQILSP